MKIDEVMMKMICSSEGNLHDIQHFLKVWGYARTIGMAENLDEHTMKILETAAIVHDISCPYCRKKYGSAPWDRQEAESAALLEEFFSSENIEEDVLARVIFLVSHHHSPQLIDGTDFQILIEADYLVNAAEHEFPKDRITAFRDSWFRTAAGRKLISSMFLQQETV